MSSSSLARQIRSARAWLDWTRDDLAARAGVAPNTLASLEKADAASEPNARTLAKITETLEKEGLSFTSDGIKYTENPIFFVEGNSHETCYYQLLEDAYEHLKTVKNPELLIMYADDKVSPPSVNDFYRKMRSEGIKMRQLIQQGNTYIMGPLEEYRYIPKDFFINRVTLVYGDRIANETANFNRAIIKVDHLAAEIQRNTFNMLWSVLEQPKESTANERF